MPYIPKLKPCVVTAWDKKYCPGCGRQIVGEAVRIREYYHTSCGKALVERRTKKPKCKGGGVAPPAVGRIIRSPKGL